MKAQGYDGAANMSGKYIGFQARLLQTVTGAMYVHNKSHCLNLAIFHSCNNVSVRNVMSAVQEIAFAFDYSAKKLQAFFDELDADAILRTKTWEKRTTLRTLCEARWTSRADALYTFTTSYPVVVYALSLTKPRRWESRAVSASIMRFQFIIALVVAEHILHSTVYLSTFLQDTECDLLEVIKESKTVIEMLRAERQDESVRDE